MVVRAANFCWSAFSLYCDTFVNRDSSWCFIEGIFKTFLRYEQMKKEILFYNVLADCVWDLKALIRKPYN